MKRRLTFTIGPQEAGMNIRAFLRERLSFSGHQISRLKFQEEGIRIDGRKVYVNHILSEGEQLTVGAYRTGTEKGHERAERLPGSGKRRLRSWRNIHCRSYMRTGTF